MSNIEICPHFTSPHFLFSFDFLKLTAATTANFFTTCCCIGIVILLVGNFYPMLRVNFSSI